MKWIVTAFLTCACLTAASCAFAGSKKSPTPQSTFAAQTGTPQEQFIADAKNEVAASFKAAYSTTFKSPSGDLHPSATWYKDGAARQRFDFQGAYEFLHVDKATVFTVGYKDHIVVCSDEFPATPTDLSTQAPKGACCEDSGGCGDAAGNMLYFLGLPLGFSADDATGPVGDLSAITITLLPQRAIAGLDARCYEFKPTTPTSDYPNAVAETCFSAGGVPLYWRAKDSSTGDREAQATLVGSTANGDFSYPHAVYTPTPQPYVYQTPVPPIPMVVRLRFPRDADPTAIDAALVVIRRRIITGPGCFDGIPVKPIDQCITTQKAGDDYVLSFGVSDSHDKMTDAEITEWLTVQGQDRVRVRFCEALQDGSGRVATVPSGQRQIVTYKAGTCEPIGNAQGQLQVSADGGPPSWITPTYADVATVQVDDLIWTPAVGDLRGEGRPMTDAYLQADAYADHPLSDNPDPSIGWRAVFRTTDDGKAILVSITTRLAPKGKSIAYQAAADEKGYPLAVFLDGQPVMNSDGHIAGDRVSRADSPPQLIYGLTRDVARRVAEALNGPALRLPVQVISVTRAP